MSIMPISQDIDLIAYTGRKLTEFLKKQLKIKPSAFFLNDTIARCLGFKGHSDYINRAIMEPLSWVKKITSPDIASQLFDRIAEKYSVELELKNIFIKHNKREAKIENALLEQMKLMALTNNTDLKTDGLYVESQLKHTKATRYASGEEYSREEAKKYILKLMQVVFDTAYLAMPVQFTLRSWVNACNCLFKKSYDSQDLLLIEKEFKTLLSKGEHSSIKDTYNCINELVELVSSIETPPEWINSTDYSEDTVLQLRVAHLFMLTKDAGLFAEKLYSSLSNKIAA